VGETSVGGEACSCSGERSVTSGIAPNSVTFSAASSAKPERCAALAAV
jgi:hypothetical protein